MGDVYKIFLLDNSEIEVTDPDIDEEARLVRILNKEGKNEDGEETSYYDYYPFEFIKKIIFLRNGN